MKDTKNTTYVIIRKDLNMSPSKISAQVAHAVARMCQEPFQSTRTCFIDYGHPSKHRIVILYVKTEDKLRSIIDKFMNNTYLGHLPCGTQVDEGINEVPENTLTAFCFWSGYFQNDQEHVKGIIQRLQVWKHEDPNPWRDGDVEQPPPRKQVLIRVMEGDWQYTIGDQPLDDGNRWSDWRCEYHRRLKLTDTQWKYIK